MEKSWALLTFFHTNNSPRVCCWTFGRDTQRSRLSANNVITYRHNTGTCIQIEEGKRNDLLFSSLLLFPDFDYNLQSERHCTAENCISNDSINVIVIAFNFSLRMLEAIRTGRVVR